MLVNRSIETGRAQRSDSCMCWNSFDYWLQTTIEFLIHLSYKIDHFQGL